ncbi:MAG: hypothetical protein V4719_20160 [Planctomycetota bacterium]
MALCVFAICALVASLYWAHALLYPDVKGVFQQYLTPSGFRWTQEKSYPFKLDWVERESDPEQKNWSAEKFIAVERCETPAVFKFLASSKHLEILDLSINQSGDRCTFTGVNTLPQLRTMQLGVYSAECTLFDCRALAQCHKLQCLRFFGGFHIAVENMREIAASKTLESIAFVNYCNFDPGVISELKHLPTLKSILVYRATSGIMHELSQVPSLEYIFFGADTWDAMLTIAELKRLPKLKQLSICLEEGKDRETLRAILPNVELTMYSDPR